jgi:hypothetical protein
VPEVFPVGCIDMQAVTDFKPAGWVKMGEPCTAKYKRGSEGKPSKAQHDAIAGTTCWWGDPVPCTNPATTPDHQPPLVAAWAAGGCWNVEAYKKWAVSVEALGVPPKGHCSTHYPMQGRLLVGTFKKITAINHVIKAFAALGAL